MVCSAVDRTAVFQSIHEAVGRAVTGGGSTMGGGCDPPLIGASSCWPADRHVAAAALVLAAGADLSALSAAYAVRLACCSPVRRPAHAVPWVVADRFGRDGWPGSCGAISNGPAQRWVGDFLSGRAVRFGWPPAGRDRGAAAALAADIALRQVAHQPVDAARDDQRLAMRHCRRKRMHRRRHRANVGGVDQHEPVAGAGIGRRMGRR